LALLIPIFQNISNSITSKTYTIKLYNIILIALFFIIENIIILHVIFKLSKNKTKKNEREIEEIHDEINYNNLDYYFEKYHKHVTVYKNGNGILINSFTVIINNINSITKFKREININDAKITSQFPKLSAMKQTKLQNRFTDFGFWYKCLNNKDLITSVREYYWSDDSNNIDTISQSDPKDLKWIMEMNPSSIEVGKPYNIVYVMSIPGMFPIENGEFKENVAHIKGTHGKFQSQFAVKHMIKNFTYTVSFENGLSLHTKPVGTISLAGTKNNLHYENDNNIIFDKYIFNTTHPKCNSVISIDWSFKEKHK
jgi:hypothetical protein